MANGNHIIHGGDYNPDQWLDTPEIWDEDMRLMKKAHINSATVGIFAWSRLEPEEGKYDFTWLDTIMDKLAQNGISAILATPSGARPPWLAQKYPQVLRVTSDGTRNLYGVRHNHCLTSPVYREKVYEINRLLAQRYKGHPALSMWHISNEYSGECHCELCRQAFIDWLKIRYNNDLDKLNFKWWGGFWSHIYTDWQQISPPSNRGENHVSALKLCWDRFITDSHISFYENEIQPLRELTPEIPITTNFMNMYDGIDYQKFAKHLDVISWDNYPEWGLYDDTKEACSVAFVHDAFRSMKGGKPFLMMESTPSLVNWKGVNKLMKPGMQELSSIQAIAHGSDSVQYFQWRKSRGGHEKYHGAVVDHCGHEDTRVFRDVSRLGEVLEKLDCVQGTSTKSEVAIVCDWENIRATKHFCGYNNERRNYVDVCKSWYAPFWKKGVSADVISMDDDLSSYKLVIAPFLYMLKDGTAQRIRNYVENSGTFVATYLTGAVDSDDLCFLGGMPGDGLSEVFGIWSEEVDSLLPGETNRISFDGKSFEAVDICELIHTKGAQVLGSYESDFYEGMPAVTLNSYGKGRAYYVTFRNDEAFPEALCENLINNCGITQSLRTELPQGVSVHQRDRFVFIMNFSGTSQKIEIPEGMRNVLTGKESAAALTLAINGYIILEK